MFYGQNGYWKILYIGKHSKSSHKVLCCSCCSQYTYPNPSPLLDFTSAHPENNRGWHRGEKTGCTCLLSSSLSLSLFRDKCGLESFIVLQNEQPTLPPPNLYLSLLLYVITFAFFFFGIPKSLNSQLQEVNTLLVVKRCLALGGGLATAHIEKNF